jgi:pimeloyl-ACP methyl ester carboxylesterase
MDFKTASAHGQTFRFCDSGEGPPVVLIHGFPDTPMGWEDTRLALNAAGFRTIVPYLRGYHPETIVAGRSYGGKEIGQDAIWLLDALELERAMLVGHDWGASVVYRAAAMAHERVRAICPVAIPHLRLLERSLALVWGGRHFITLRLPSGPWLARRSDFAYLDVLMRRWAPTWSGSARDATLADVKRAFADPRVLEGAISYYRDVSAGDGLGRISVPGLVVGGTTDIVPPELFSRSGEFFDAPCEVLIADGAGHWPHRERPEPFHERLLAFLAGLPD